MTVIIDHKVTIISEEIAVLHKEIKSAKRRLEWLRTKLGELVPHKDKETQLQEVMAEYYALDIDIDAMVNLRSELKQDLKKFAKV